MAGETPAMDATVAVSEKHTNHFPSNHLILQNAVPQPHFKNSGIALAQVAILCRPSCNSR